MHQHSISPRRRKLVLFFTYGLMTAAVIAISTICLLLVLGYRFDFAGRTVEQGGLLQFRSVPEGAKIILDGQELSFVTPGKRNVDVGTHEVHMRRDGYREWSKTVSVKAGELRWLNYARLIPTNLTTSTVHELPALADEKPSPDRKWIALLPAADKPELTLVDIRPDKPVLSSLVLPSTSFSTVEGQPHQFSIVEWDFGSRFMLLKHVTGDITEFIRIDRTNPAATQNLTSLLGVALSDVHFSGTSGNVFYGLEGTNVRKLDSAAGTISQPIIKDVTRFMLYKTDTIAFTTHKQHTIGAGVYVDQKAYIVRSYDDTVPVLAEVTSYFSKNYLAVSRGTQVELIKEPERTKGSSASTPKVSLPAGVQWLRFNASGRFVAAGNGTQYALFDIETNERFTVNLPGTAADLAKPLQWLDDYSLVSSADKDLRITEFDGGNQQVIIDAEPGYAATLNDDGKLLYSIARTQSGSFILQATKLRVEN
jgi:hypothetical protein